MKVMGAPFPGTARPRASATSLFRPEFDYIDTRDKSLSFVRNIKVCKTVHKNVVYIFLPNFAPPFLCWLRSLAVFKKKEMFVDLLGRISQRVLRLGRPSRSPLAPPPVPVPLLPPPRPSCFPSTTPPPCLPPTTPSPCLPASGTPSPHLLPSPHSFAPKAELSRFLLECGRVWATDGGGETTRKKCKEKMKMKINLGVVNK